VVADCAFLALGRAAYDGVSVYVEEVVEEADPEEDPYAKYYEEEDEEVAN